MPLAPLSERLVAFLSMRGPLPRHHLAFRLWPDQPEEQSLGCLRTALWRLPRPGGDPLVQADAATVWLADHVQVDVHRRYAEVAGFPGSAPVATGRSGSDDQADHEPG